MPEGSFQFLTLGREADTPLIGELREGEVTINVVDGRLWVGDEFSNPIELGGNCQESLISTGSRSNYIYVEVNDPGAFPVEIPDPNQVVPGTYRELFVMMVYSDEYDISNLPPTIYFTNTILWDDSDYDITNPDEPLAPPSYIGAPNVKVLYKLFSFGPQTSWYGKIAWINS